MPLIPTTLPQRCANGKGRFPGTPASLRLAWSTGRHSTTATHGVTPPGDPRGLLSDVYPVDAKPVTERIILIDNRPHVHRLKRTKPKAIACFCDRHEQLAEPIDAFCGWKNSRS